MKKQPTARGRGRPRLGEYRVECTVPRAVLDELLRREQATGQYRSRICADILCDELIGGITRQVGSPHQI
jgi:hypothetical protein